MNTTMKRHSLNSFSIWSGESHAPSPLSIVKADMPNQVHSTKPLIRTKLLNWFAKYTLISQRRTQAEVNTALRWHNAELSSRNHKIEARLERLEKVLLHKWEREPTGTD